MKFLFNWLFSPRAIVFFLLLAVTNIFKCFSSHFNCLLNSFKNIPDKKCFKLTVGVPIVNDAQI